MTVEEKAGFCTLCRSRCGTINVVEDGRRLVAVRPNPAHPTGKAICAKGRAAPEIVHSPRRLTTPLRRTAPKGAADPGFVPLTWPEALDRIAERLDAFRRESGPESVAFSVTSGSSSSLSDSLDWIQRFIRGFGSPNSCLLTEICNWHKDHAHEFTFGCGLPAADYSNANLILLWGHNPANVWLAQAEAIGAARAAGAKVAVIDPRRGGSASDADLWLRVRPGTDGVLALALARLLIEREAYDRSFVAGWSNAPFLVRDDDGRFLRGRDLGWTDGAAFVVWTAGAPAEAGAPGAALRGAFAVPTPKGEVACRTAFDRYAEATEAYDLVTASEITGTPAEAILALVDAIATASRIAYHCWTGVAQHLEATQTERAIATLYLLTGSFDRRGGNVRLPSHPVPPLHCMDMIPTATRAKALGLAERPLGPPSQGWITPTSLYDAVLTGEPYRVRALFGFGANLLKSHPGEERGRRALEALEFQVHCDLFMNPTAAYADIVLPVTSAWEHEALRVGFEISAEAQELVQLRQAMVPPVGEAKPDLWIVFQLAKRLGLGELFLDGEVEAGFDHLLEPIGLNVQTLRQHPGGLRRPLPLVYEKYRQQGFATETGRAELYSERLLRHGQAPVPRFNAPAARESGGPLILFSANNGYFCHGQHRGIASLRRRRPDPLAAIHPTTAAERGIGEGDWIRVQSRHGAVRMRARLDDALDPDVVACDYGWWEPAPDLGLEGHEGHAGRPGANFNVLLGERLRDPVSGALPLRSIRGDVTLERAAGWVGLRAFRIAERHAETPDVTVLTLVPEDATRPLAGFRPGQFISIELDGLRRSYSLIGKAVETPADYRIAVRRQPGGAMSERVARLAAGRRIAATAPAGSFLLPLENEFPVVLIAGGIGITPFLPYLDALTGKASEPEIVLHHGCRDLASVPFRQHIAALAAGLPNVTVAWHPSRSAEGGETRRFSAAAIPDALIRRRARFYLCASDGMMNEVAATLQGRGVQPFEIFRERFISPVPVQAQGFSAREVTFARNCRTVTWTPQAGSLLRLFEANAIQAPSGCRVGQCESCAVRVIRGEVQHLTETPPLDDGFCLACIAVPRSDLLLDL